MQIKYKRVLLKFSGEALAGGNERIGIDPKVIQHLVDQIKQIVALNVQVGLVLGGGNFFRGDHLARSELVSRITGDQMGMLATVINSLVFRDAFAKAGLVAEVMSAVPILGMVKGFDRIEAIRHLEQHKIVIFAAGTGNPLVTTDSAAILRALEINAEILLKATKVDGIYAKDPRLLDGKEDFYKQLTYQEILQQEFGVMDLNAVLQARDHKMKIIVFNITKPGALLNIIYGKQEGTLVTEQGN